MEMLANRQAMWRWCSEVRQRGERLGFVPTMGALHDGHLSLVRAAQKQADRVIVSIFVNPTQFGPHEDFDRYPRPLEQDQHLLTKAGCSALFHPPVEEVFAADCRTVVRVEPLGHDLCGRFRPHHFQGVATVVALLLNLLRPDQVFFGWKDYQQVILIQRMVHDLAIPVEVLGLPTQREADGLALSSRNRYLTPDERQKAVGLYQALQAARQAWHGNQPFAHSIGAKTLSRVDSVRSCARQVLTSFGIQEIDYIEVRDAKTLDALSKEEQGCLEDPVMLIAARLGATRLIDNMVLSLETTPDFITEPTPLA